jgi:hypothetical protein
MWNIPPADELRNIHLPSVDQPALVHGAPAGPT